MPSKWCPICGAELYQQQMTIGGITDWYWVCPEGDWEEPVSTVLAKDDPDQQ